MARVRDYAAEYARRQARAREAGFRSYYAKRVAGTAPGSDERARKAGHRGPAEFERIVQSGRAVFVQVRGKYSDQIVARVVDDRGRTHMFYLQRKPPGTAAGRAAFDRQADRWEDMADTQQIEFDWGVSP